MKPSGLHGLTSYASVIKHFTGHIFVDCRQQKFVNQQECIPVGSVSQHALTSGGRGGAYPRTHWAGGASSGGCLPGGGGCLPGRVVCRGEEVCQRGVSAQGGVSDQGVWQTPPMDRQTPVKHNLRKLRLRVVMMC